MKHLMYAVTMIGSMVLGTFLGLYLAQQRQDYMETEDALIAAEHAGLERQAKYDTKLLMDVCIRPMIDLEKSQ